MLFYHPTKFRSKDINPDYDPAKDVSTYSYWVASVVGPVVYIVAVIHALLWKQLSGVVGSIVSCQFDTVHNCIDCA